MEVIALLLTLIGTAVSIYGIFSKTDRLLTEIRNVLVDIRDQGRPPR